MFFGVFDLEIDDFDRWHGWMKGALRVDSSSDNTPKPRSQLVTHLHAAARPEGGVVVEGVWLGLEEG